MQMLQRAQINTLQTYINMKLKAGLRVSGRSLGQGAAFVWVAQV